MINKITISGEIIDEFEFDHEVLGEKFYRSYVASMRESGVYDVLPVLVSERVLNINPVYKGDLVKVYGTLRSYDLQEETRNRLILNVFVQGMECIDELDANYYADVNRIELDAFICKKPIFRTTPKGREISDLLVANNRTYGKSDYIPCICWGRNARYMSNMDLGKKMKLFGRLQSRQYKKLFDNNTYEERVAYEVSVSSFEELEE